MFKPKFSISPSELQAICDNSKQYKRVELSIQPSKNGAKGAWLNVIFYTEEDKPDIAMMLPEVFNKEEGLKSLFLIFFIVNL